MLKKKNFGKKFKWGVTISAFQNEGAAYEDGKSASIWDTFTSDIQNINDGNATGKISAFYQNYKEDLKQAGKLGFDVFRFSLSWPRIIPDGKGKPNPKGIDFYDRVNDARRKKYHQKMLKQVNKAIKRDIPVVGYFVWTLVDNFEWREGFQPRFGLVYNDFKTQKRTVKASGWWFKDFLSE